MQEFQRFDRFNALYNPGGVAAFRTIFLKTSNHQDGKYFAELLKQEMKTRSSRTHTEMRLSIYGKSMDEWAELAKFVKRNDFYSDACKRSNKWMIQTPRIFRIFAAQKAVASYKELIQNIFEPSEKLVVTYVEHVYVPGRSSATQ